MRFVNELSAAVFRLLMSASCFHGLGEVLLLRVLYRALHLLGFSRAPNVVLLFFIVRLLEKRFCCIWCAVLLERQYGITVLHIFMLAPWRTQHLLRNGSGLFVVNSLFRIRLRRDST